MSEETQSPETKAPDTNGPETKGPETKTDTPAGIGMTEAAAKEVIRIIAEEGLPEGTALRVGAKGGGCSGFSYVLDFDQNGKTEFDVEYHCHGVTILIDKKSEFFMSGTTIDFNNGLLNRGFVFVNPMASGSCGCGTSFSV